jgi:hypothetical protein
MRRSDGARRAAVAAVVAAALAGAACAGAGDLHVTPITRDGRVFVTFDMQNGVDQEVRAAVRSGLPTELAYSVELKRRDPLWPDKTLAEASVGVRVRYDTLTRIYQVARSHDGRVEEAFTSEDEGRVFRQMTFIERAPLFNANALEPNVEYYVEVRATMRPHNSWFVWPWRGAATTGSGKFTYIP